MASLIIASQIVKVIINKYGRTSAGAGQQFYRGLHMTHAVFDLSTIISVDLFGNVFIEPIAFILLL